jgi:predicted ArsR family transcriptional regulator
MVLESTAPLSAADLARRLGKRPDTLYHHLRALQRAGLVLSEGAASTGGRPGSMWRLAMSPLRVSFPGGLPSAHVGHVERVVGVLARSSVREYRRALRHAAAEGGPVPTAKRACTWLDPAEHRALEKELHALVARLLARGPRKGRTPFVLTCLLASVAGEPAAPGRKGRPRASAARKG